MFEDLGLKYIGPVDGHDVAAVEQALTPGQEVRRPGAGARADHARARATTSPSRNENDQMHQVGAVRPDDRRGRNVAPAGWTVGVPRGDRRASATSGPTSSAITAAMLYPVGLRRVRRQVPRPRLRRRHRRAARGHQRRRPGDGRPAPGGGGLRDVPQPGLRPGAAGRGAAPVRRDLRARPRRRHRRRRASHNGMWDMSLLQIVPGLRIAAPRDGAQLRELLREAVDVDDAPTVRPLRQGRGARRPPGDRPDRHGSTCCSATTPRTC